MAVDVTTAFLGAGIIIFLGFFGELIFSKTGIPDVLWLILVGVLLGPVTHSIEAQALAAAAPYFTTFALIFLLFAGSLDIKLRDLLRGMFPATVLTVVTFLLTILMSSFIGFILGWPSYASLLLGIILGGTSSAVVIPMVKQLQVSREAALVLKLESAISDVLVIVAAIATIDVVTSNAFSVAQTVNNLLGSFAIAILVGGIVGYAWMLLSERFEILRNFYMVTAALLLITYSVVDYIGASGAIAGLSMGIVIGNFRKISKASKDEEVEKELKVEEKDTTQFYNQISFFLKTFFFVYIGVLMEFTNPVLLGVSLLLVILLLGVRPLAVRMSLMKVTSQDRAVMQSLIPKGLAAAVLAQLPAQAGLAGTEGLQTVVFGGIFFSIVLGTLLMFGIRYLGYQGIPLGPVVVPAVETKASSRKSAGKTA